MKVSVSSRALSFLIGWVDGSARPRSPEAEEAIDRLKEDMSKEPESPRLMCSKEHVDADMLKMLANRDYWASQVTQSRLLAGESSARAAKAEAQATEAQKQLRVLRDELRTTIRERESELQAAQTLWQMKLKYAEERLSNLDKQPRPREKYVPEGMTSHKLRDIAKRGHYPGLGSDDVQDLMTWAMIVADLEKEAASHVCEMEPGTPWTPRDGNYPPTPAKPVRLLVEVVQGKDEAHKRSWAVRNILMDGTLWAQLNLDMGESCCGLSVRELPPMPSLSMLTGIYLCAKGFAEERMRAVLRAVGLEVKE